MKKPCEPSEHLRNYLSELAHFNFGFENVDFSDIHYRNSEGESALHPAIRHNDIEAAKELIALGLDLDAKDDMGETPLHIAASHGHLEIFAALVEGGASLVAVAVFGATPLSLAESMGHPEIIRFALNRLFSAFNSDDPDWRDLHVLTSYLDYHNEKAKTLRERIENGDYIVTKSEQDGDGHPDTLIAEELVVDLKGALGGGESVDGSGE